MALLSMCDIANRLPGVSAEDAFCALIQQLAKGWRPKKLVMSQAWLDRVNLGEADAAELGRLLHDPAPKDGA